MKTNTLKNVIKKYTGSYCSLLILLCCSWGAVAESDFIPISGALPPTVPKEEKPYLVTEPLEIMENEHTVIEKGVVFLFKNFTGLDVNGTIRVEGTEEEPVVFTSENDTVYNPAAQLEPAPFDWDGITVRSGKTENVFEYCSIQYSLFGIKSLTKNILLKECIFLANGNADFTIEGEKQSITNPYSYNPEEAEDRIVADSETASLDATYQEEIGPVSELDTETEEQGEGRKSGKVSLTTDTSRPRPRKRIALRLISMATAFAGGALGIKETLDYISAKKKFDKIDDCSYEDKLKYTTEDWELAKDRNNKHLTYMLSYYGVALLGVTVFTFSFVF